MIQKKLHFVATWMFPMLVLFFSCKDRQEKKAAALDAEIVQLQNWIEQSKNQDLKRRVRKEALQKALTSADGLGIDSLRNKYYSKISLAAYYLDDSLLFRKVNKDLLALSQDLEDSISMAESYWDLGNFFLRDNSYDSAYYAYNRANEIFRKKNEDLLRARMLINMAIIQIDVKDYIGSEVTTMKAIELLQPLEADRQLYSSYNNLGIIHNGLGEYDLALKYHNKALEYQEKLDKKDLRVITTLNNIGVVHKNRQHYKQAIAVFDQALERDSLYEKDPQLFAKVLDNRSYASFKLGQVTNLSDTFQKALQIREEIGDFAGIIVSKLHLAEYHSAKDKDQALQYALEARALAAKTNNNSELLKSLKLISELDQERGLEALNEYIQLNDALLEEERNIRNKFARIRFETDEYIAKNQYLTRERKLYYAGSVTVIGIVLLVFVNIHQRNRNKQLRLEQDQQRLNEEIYNLLLVQQNKLEEGRFREKNRISKELHDGILGRLFGTRLMLESLYDKSDEASLENRKKFLHDLSRIETDLRSLSHELNSDVLSKKEGFSEILQEYLEKQETIGNFELYFQNDDQILWEEVDNKTKINLFRIVQEAFNNILKYAGAKFVLLKFAKEGDHIVMTVRDNGKGFDTRESSKGIGLKNMQSRAESLGGNLLLRSGKKGTEIKIVIPQKSWVV